jgi:hypothetical protein
MIKNNTTEKVALENIYLPPKNGLIEVAWEVLHYIKLTITII